MVTLYFGIFLVTIAMTAYIVLKSVRMGLQWALQVNQGQTPTTDKNIIVEQIEKKQEQKETQQQEQKTLNIMSEWLNGGETK